MPVVLVAVVGVITAGCGSDHKSNSSATTPVSTTAAASGMAPRSETGRSSAAGAGTPGDVVLTASVIKYGQDPDNMNLYKGAGGFEVDTSKCPPAWDPNQGITESEIRLFTSLPKSGALAGFGFLADGSQSYFNMVNANGGIGGRKIVLDSKDDGYKRKQTKTNVDAAMQSGKYAALYLTLGTPNNLAIWDETNEECMPQLLNATGAPQWGDVEHHPWTTGMQLDYFTEAKLWVEWLKKYQPNAKVATITLNNDFGASYLKAFKSAIKGTSITFVGDFPHDPAAPTLDNQFRGAAASGADILLLETTGVYCTEGMAAVERNGSWHPTVIMSSTCGSLNQFFQPLIEQGLTGEGTYIIQTYKDGDDPAYANDPIVRVYKEQSTKDGLDPTKSTYFTGWIFAWYMTEILNEAASYQGGLNRANIMVAARSIDKTNPILIDGLSSEMNGMRDAYLTEGGRMVQYKVTDPKQLGTFVPSGDLINLEGQLGTYASVLARRARPGG